MQHNGAPVGSEATETKESRHSFLDLPREIKFRILTICSVNSILDLSVASREWRTIGASDGVWQVAFQHQWPRLFRRNDTEGRISALDKRSPYAESSCDDNAHTPSSSSKDSWLQSFKDRWISTGGKPEDNCKEDWADFDFMCTTEPSQPTEEHQMEVLRDFKRRLRKEVCACTQSGRLSETCCVTELMPHLYVCRRSGISHYCTVSSGEEPCALSIENYRGNYTCELTGISTIFASEPEALPPPIDEYEMPDYMNEDMERKQMLEQEFERGYSMTDKEADEYFGEETSRTTLLCNPNFPDARRSKRRKT